MCRSSRMSCSIKSRSRLFLLFFRQILKITLLFWLSKSRILTKRILAVKKLKIKKLDIKKFQIEKLQVKKRCKVSCKLKGKYGKIFVILAPTTLITCLLLLPFIPRSFLKYYAGIVTTIIFLEADICSAQYVYDENEDLSAFAMLVIGTSFVILSFVWGSILI